MKNRPTEPWEPVDATYSLREMARSPVFSIAYKLHATERMQERGLIVSDLLFLLKNGHVRLKAEKSTSVGYYKYCIDGCTPNSGGRELRAVVVPNFNDCKLKLVTFMWKDEGSTKSGSILGE